jgi:hypothetical protein
MGYAIKKEGYGWRSIESEIDCNENEIFSETQPEFFHKKQTYDQLRASEYPPISDYIDGVVKGDENQIKAYIDACKAVKIKYPKE